jgi:glycerophosphoryl diester phosphodiesterase
MKSVLQTLGFFLLLWLVIVVGLRLIRSQSTWTSADQHPPRCTVIAHRGGLGDGPENTLTAMRTAIGNGADVLEFDLWMSRDGHLVVIHDATLDRTTNCSGPVTEKTLEELQSCDAAYFFSPDPAYANRRDRRIYEPLPEERLASLFPLRGKGITIPSLEAVFQAFPQRSMVIEIKQNTPSLVESFCQMIRQYHKDDQIIVGSFQLEPLDAFRLTCPEVMTSAAMPEAGRFVLLEKVYLSGLLSTPYQALQLPPSIPLFRRLRLPPFPVIGWSLIRTAHDRGLVVQAWTINDPEDMKRLIAAGIDGIMTDYPGRLIEVLETKQVTPVHTVYSTESFEFLSAVKPDRGLGQGLRTQAIHHQRRFGAQF